MHDEFQRQIAKTFIQSSFLPSQGSLLPGVLISIFACNCFGYKLWLQLIVNCNQIYDLCHTFCTLCKLKNPLPWIARDSRVILAWLWVFLPAQRATKSYTSDHCPLLYNIFLQNPWNFIYQKIVVMAYRAAGHTLESPAGHFCEPCIRPGRQKALGILQHWHAGLWSDASAWEWPQASVMSDKLSFIDLTVSHWHTALHANKPCIATIWQSWLGAYAVCGRGWLWLVLCLAQWLRLWDL